MNFLDSRAKYHHRRGRRHRLGRRARMFAQQGVAVALFDRDGEGAEHVASVVCGAEGRQRTGRRWRCATSTPSPWQWSAPSASSMASISWSACCAARPARLRRPGPSTTTGTRGRPESHRSLQRHQVRGNVALRRRGGGAIANVGRARGLRMSMNNGVKVRPPRGRAGPDLPRRLHELGRDNIRECGAAGAGTTPQMKAADQRRAPERAPRKNCPWSLGAARGSGGADPVLLLRHEQRLHGNLRDHRQRAACGRHRAARRVRSHARPHLISYRSLACHKS